MSAQWTVMVYMAGNNSLSDAAGVDLKEMGQVGSSDDVRVCVFVKQSDGDGARRLIVGKGGHDEAEEKLGEVDSGDPQSVVDFVRWAVENAPAERYALVLWNHGGGWRPGDLDQVYSEVRGASSSRMRHGEVNHRATQPLARALFTTTVEKVASLSTRGEREICSDDGSGHSLDTIELGNVCRLIRGELGKPIDVLGMDACLMSNLEVAYQVRDDVSYVVGSECMEPGAGWPYELVLGDLHESPHMDGAALVKTVTDRYIESYKDQEGVWPVTQCGVATAAIAQLAEPLDALSNALLEELSTGWPQLMSAQTRAVPLEPAQLNLVDLGSLGTELSASKLSDPSKAAAKAVSEALNPGGYVLAEGHLGDTVKGCQGVSVYLPAPSDSVSRFYGDLVFAQQHRWDELLKGYGDAVRGGQ